MPLSQEHELLERPIAPALEAREVDPGPERLASARPPVPDALVTARGQELVHQLPHPAPGAVVEVEPHQAGRRSGEGESGERPERVGRGTLEAEPTRGRVEHGHDRAPNGAIRVQLGADRVVERQRVSGADDLLHSGQAKEVPSPYM